MGNGFIALCYMEAKKAGVDTTKMSTDEVIEWYNKNKSKEKAKGELKDLILKTKETQDEKKSQEPNKSDNSDINKHFVEKIDRINEKELQSKITECLDRIVRSDVEHSVVIDKNGNIYENTGDAEFVEDMGVDLDGAIDMHNHLEDVSFGQDDFNFFHDKVGTEFIAVTPKYVHKLKVIKEIDKPYNHFYRHGLKIDGNSNDQQHNVMEYLQSEGYVKYERTERNS